MKIRHRDNQKGFTLVELIIVMAILAVLAGIAVPKFGDVLADSKTKADQANIKMIQSAFDIYCVQNDVSDPTSIDWTAAELTTNLVTNEKLLKENPKYPVDTAKNYEIIDGVVDHE